jgi:hypothetical protein
MGSQQHATDATPVQRLLVKLASQLELTPYPLETLFWENKFTVLYE